MGNYIRPLSDAVFTIASDDLWIESLAIQQLHTTANLPNMQRVVGMPDLHPGRGYPIGAAFFSVGRFYPALVGNDIGCGMALWQTDILTRKYNADKFEKRLSDLDDVAEEKLAGGKPAVSICTASVAQLAWLYRWRQSFR